MIIPLVFSDLYIDRPVAILVTQYIFNQNFSVFWSTFEAI